VCQRPEFKFELQQLSEFTRGQIAAQGYDILAPTHANRFSFRPSQVRESYYSWPIVAELAASDWLLGLNENRGEALIDADRAALAERMRRYLDASVSMSDLPSELDALRRDWAGFDPVQTRAELLSGGFEEGKLVRFLAKPFDLRWAYAETRAGLWNRSRSTLVRHAALQNRFIMVRCRAPRADDGAAFNISRSLADQHALHKDAYLIPFLLAPSEQEQASMLEEPREAVANLSESASRYLASIGSSASDGEKAKAEAVWLHVLATGYAPTYLHENADGIRLDWPRIPLPAGRDALLASAKLGGRVAALLDVEEPVDGVTTGSLRYELRPLGPVATANGRQLDPASGDLAVSARWGIRGKGGITMPGKGRIEERPYTAEEQALLREGAAALGLSYDQLLTCLGETTCDVFLNEHAYWRCVPIRAWKYTIGGYQVVKKWLSYRERALLRRDLKPEEARYVTEMVRRISAILLLEPALDASYERVKADVYEWGKAASPNRTPLR